MMSQETKTILSVGGVLALLVVTFGVGACHQLSDVRGSTDNRFLQVNRRIDDLVTKGFGSQAETDSILRWNAMTFDLLREIQRVLDDNRIRARSSGASQEPELGELSQEWAERLQLLAETDACPVPASERSSLDWVECVLSSGKAGSSRVQDVDSDVSPGDPRGE